MFFARKLKIANLIMPLLFETIIFRNLNICCNAATVAPAISAVTINSNQMQLKTLSNFFKENCTCKVQWQCECCAKVNNDLLSIHQTLCADWKVFSNSWDIQANVRLNENILYTNTFSAWSIPPFCLPIWPAIALTGCVQMHSITQHNLNTLHGCANASINFITFNLINWPIGCMDVGTGGIQIVEPHHDVNITSTNELPPEIELETSDLLATPSNKANIELNEKVALESLPVLRGSMDNFAKKPF